MKAPILSIILAIALRIILSWHNVVGEDIKFTCPDSYYFMNLAINDPTQRLWAFILHLPAWLLSGGEPSQYTIEKTAIFIAPLLAGGIVYFVYLIAKHLFGGKAGILAAFIIAIIPGEFFGRSILGSCDHHIAEVFLTTGAMAFITIGERENNWWYAFGAFGFMLVYHLLWEGSWLFIGILGLYALWKVWKLGSKWRALSLTGAIGGILLLWTSGIFSQIFNFDGTILRETSEARTAFSLLGLSGFILPKCLLTIPLLYLTRKNVLILIWGAVVVISTLWQVRFDYYLAVPLSLLLGHIMAFVYGQIKTGATRQSAIIALSTMLIIYSAFCASWFMNCKIDRNMPDDEFIEACKWIKGNTLGDCVVVSWWDYGYWIVYYSERKAMADNAQDRENIETANKIIEGSYGLSKTQYLLVDKRMMKIEFTGMPQVDLSEKELIYDRGVMIFRKEP